MNILNHLLVPVFNQEDAIEDLGKIFPLLQTFHCDLHVICLDLRQELKDRKRRRFGILHRKKKQGPASIDDFPISQFLKLFPELRIHNQVLENNQLKGLEDFCYQNEMDAILWPGYCRTQASGWIERRNITAFFETSSCPLLSVSGNHSLNEIKNIVIQVGYFLPMRSLLLASSIALHYEATIHLVSLNKRFLPYGRQESSSLYKAYQLLHDNTCINIECSTLTSSDIGLGSIQYAQRVHAELMLMNMGNKLSLKTEAN